ncbi:xanthine dehydrogenase family protein molybdopterin-binding subunit [Pseudomaricurvus alcaniphilus]|uniref:xanthine dehydrogenase family protein molybdopterin-binding subunit n=1 Tax=Pseudomaricurvus alcaniphilus TaxID=1166482 RepID=UPI0014085097|nr:molybdopterin cofactor-binding domain-containing protein [Pseudomaricurvus alcaniphilus]NHN37521.1 xanthine dehydrogenase family protein molybdopterin-binding subunit [Pseudomaricurvus alcaniphilus]
MSATRELSRRGFLRMGAAAGGLVFTLQLLPFGQRSAAAAAEAAAAVLPGLSPNLFVELQRDGGVIITCHRSEMGQQTRTSMAQLVADELEADWARVVVRQAPGDPKYGDQNTDGSKSVRLNFTRLRQAGASVRQLLHLAAADTWQVPVAECSSELGVVYHRASGRQLGYGELVDRAAALPLPEPASATLKTRDQWRYIGKAVASVDLDDVLHGTARFGMDVQLPGMLVAVIARPPVVFGRVKSLDDKAARATPGVVDVIQLDPPSPPVAFKALGGVAVIADNTWTALQARGKLEIDWLDGDNGDYDSGQFMESMVATVGKPGTVVRAQGDVDRALAGATKTVEAVYRAPHLAHATMEPPAATAVVTAASAEVWACTQNPQAARSSVAEALGLKPEQVVVHVTLLGGGFGRKSKQDFVVEAALLARATGKPVKVVWSREDDIQHDYYHTISAQYLKAGLDAEGKTIGWLQRTVFPSIGSTFNAGQVSPLDFELGMGAQDNPFAIDNLRIEKGEAKAYTRIGWLRSVINILHTFSAQSFACELAQAAGADPKDYLLQLIGPARTVELPDLPVKYANYGAAQAEYPIDTGRLRHVIETVAERSDWNRKRKQGRALGIAAHRSFLSYVATVVEVEVKADGSWIIPSVHTVIDAGTVVNTDHVTAQCEGGTVFGVSCAIGAISFREGRAQQSNFHDYRVARMSQAPRMIDVHIVPSSAPPAGVGEPPTPPVAPALCNAIQVATGKRIRDLPVPLRL